MLRKKLESEPAESESESDTEIADSGFLIIHEKQADSGSRIRIRIAIPGFSFRQTKLYFSSLKFA